MMMQRFRFLGLAVLAVFGLSAMASSVASAAEMVLPGFLPAPAAGETVTGTGGAVEWGFLGAKIRCTGLTSQQLFNTGSDNLGTFTIDFKGCSLGEKQCHSLGDTITNEKEGIILAGGTWHLVLILTPSDVHVVLFLLQEVHVECAFAASKLLLLRGDMAGVITGSGKTYKLEFNEPKAEEQEIKEFENNAGEKVKTEAEGSINGGAFKSLTYKAEVLTLTFPIQTEIMN
jgi:hypothetical protein